MSPNMRLLFVLTTLYVLILAYESQYGYGTPFVYPHVFMKLLMVYYAFFIYTFYKGAYYLKFDHVVYFILICFCLNVLIVHPETLSLAAFSNHERGVYSTSVYMLVVPFFYFLSKYFYEGKLGNLAASLSVLVAIVFFQHRTVWVVTAAALVIYYFLIQFRTYKPINIVGKALPIASIIGIGLTLCSTLVFSMHPEVVEKLQDNFSDIENFESQGTGAWRYAQWLSYWPFIQDNFLFGMRFDGFELPIQFYREDLDKPMFEDGNGHFFHSFYIDVLFYVGAAGLVLYVSLFALPLIKALRAKYLTINQIILVTFVSTGFVFGFSYILPPFYYGILGWCIVALEKEKVQKPSYLTEFAKRIRDKKRASPVSLIGRI
ncbi:O-antigen ligase family protein [Pontibacter ummariensis]|nr:O-antigen ligase family protein [Pontibacter ummariensis]